MGANIRIHATFLQMLDGKKVLMIPKDGEMAFNKIDIDFILCSHDTWNRLKKEILMKVLNKPKVIFVD